MAATLVGGTLLALPALSACSATPAPAAAAAAKPKLTTATVAKKNLEETSTETGTVDYGETRDLPTDLAGTVTEVPQDGKVVANGGVLYRLDTRVVVRFNGTVPAWRPLGPGVSDGADVAQLERALKALGYADDLKVDNHWSSGTTETVKKWQDAVGLADTGTISLGQVVFTNGDVRVQNAVAKVGDRVQPGTPILKVGGDTRQVTASLQPSQKALAPVGAKVGLSFPDGTTATGKVDSVVLQPGDGGQQKESLAVTVSLPRDPAVDKQLDGSSVQATFTHVLAKDVLAVPVTALVALASGGYGVQVVGANGSSSYVPVDTGVFADTDVEITSDAIKSGDKVLVTP